MCNNSECQRKIEKLEKKAKAGWRQFFILKEDMVSVIENFLTIQTIQDLTEKQKKAIKNLLEDTKSECSICMEILKKNNNILIINCGHFFCKVCLINSVVNCPNCREPISLKKDL